MCKAYLIWSALEARSGEVSLSPYFLMEGVAGAGKTLISNLLYPPEIALILANDAKGVGQIEFHREHRIFKVDDATEAFWNSSELLGTIYTMYHNSRTAKVHLSKSNQVNPASIAVITSNEYHNLHKFGAICDGEGAKRRFLTIVFNQELEGTERAKITNETCQELLNLLIDQRTTIRHAET